MTRTSGGSKPDIYEQESVRTRRQFLMETRAEMVRNLAHVGDNPIARESLERLLAEFDRLLEEISHVEDAGRRRRA